MTLQRIEKGTNASTSLAVITHLFPPDRQIRRLNELNSTGRGPSGPDLAIRAERGEQLRLVQVACSQFVDF